MTARFVTWAFRAAGSLGLILVFHACGGSDFSAAGDNDAGLPDSGAPPRACLGPEDCADGDACTVDLCGATGSCANPPKCGPTQQCCDGTCGECCSAVDCDDGNPCTSDQCTTSLCTHIPDHALCGADAYCSISGGCQPRETCNGADPTECDDQDPCTTDSCVGTLCDHPFCDGLVCCPGVGCAAECCDNSGCDDGQACTDDICNNGVCENPLNCPDGDTCCAETGTCASCCSSSDCPDDGLGCTNEACIGGVCTSEDFCEDRTLQCNHQTGACEPRPACDGNDDCNDDNPCTTESCVMGICAVSGCPTGTTCCGSSCQACCEASQCDDHIPCTRNNCSSGGCSYAPDDSYCQNQGLGLYCEPGKGCIQCRADVDCQLNMPLAPIAPCGEGTPRCVNNVCFSGTSSCPVGYQCCLEGCRPITELCQGFASE